MRFCTFLTNFISLYAFLSIFLSIFLPFYARSGKCAKLHQFPLYMLFWDKNWSFFAHFYPIYAFFVDFLAVFYTFSILLSWAGEKCKFALFGHISPYICKFDRYFDRFLYIFVKYFSHICIFLFVFWIFLSSPWVGVLRAMREKDVFIDGFMHIFIYFSMFLLSFMKS